ncbi:MAG: exodeoxyribonuclease V subunit gamma [Arenicellales bacterium]|nr:exodeoxyribonuclease V subunit gamma [Arenicellales bacterium]
MLHVCYGNRLEALAERLVQDRESPFGSALEPELIAVQGHAVARWLSLRLATAQGIVANTEMLFPAELLWRLFRQVLPNVPQVNSFSAEALTWRVLALLEKDSLVSQHGALADYLQNASPLQYWQLAERLGRLFEQYLIFRPDWIRRFEGGDADHWQGMLWQQMVACGDDRHWLKLGEELLAVLRGNPACRARLPQRISLFALPRLSRVYLELLVSVAAYCDIHLYTLNFSQAFWADIVSDKERARLELGSDQALGGYLDTGNSLLASMGRQGREHFAQLVELDALEEDVFSAPSAQSLLGQLQADIFYLREGGAGQPTSKAQPGDGSVQLHVCHGPMREVEVLHDQLLEHFQQDASLTPADILVLVPEIENYAPYIDAVFGAADEGRRIPFRVADRGALGQWPLVETFLALLDLPTGRFDADAVSAPLDEPALRRRFDLSESDVDRIHQWIRDTGIRWGVDADDVTALDLPLGADHTWRNGRDRLVLGQALPDSDVLFGGISPWALSDTAEAQTVGRLCSYLERVFALRRQLSGVHTVADWTERLNGLLDRFFVTSADSEPGLRIVRDALAASARIASHGGYSGVVDLAVFRQGLIQRLAVPGRGHFLSGAVTFAALAPGRCLPARFVCLLGMNDEAFPRRDIRCGFDLIRLQPRAGDRRQRDEDRQVFLEALMSARECLYISCTGRDVRDDSVKPPSVLVSELRDYIDRNCTWPAGDRPSDGMTVEHPMQAFSPRYFDGSSVGLFSYARELIRPDTTSIDRPRALLASALPVAEPAEAVTLENLVLFFSNPARALLRERLDVRLETVAGRLQTREPTVLGFYDVLALRKMILAAQQRGDSLDTVKTRLRAAGHLPGGTPGDRVAEVEWQRLGPLTERLLAVPSKEPQQPLELSLDIAGTRLLARLQPLSDGGMVDYSVMNLAARDRLRFWLSHLCLNACDEVPAARSTLIGPDRVLEFTAVGRPADLLAGLLALYREGLTRPLPVFPRSAGEYARAGGDPMKAALRTWQGSPFTRGESEDAYFQLAFRDADSDLLDDEFEQLAHEVFAPLIEHTQEVL